MLKNNYITEEWRRQGLSLTVDGNEILELRQHGEVIARFSQTGVTPENILKVSQRVFQGRLN